jgi:hypothetical protein
MVDRDLLPLAQATPAAARIFQHVVQRSTRPNLDALCAYLLVAIAKQRKNLPQSLWEILQVISVSSLEQIPLHELLMNVDTRTGDVDIPNQLEIKYS